MSLGSSATAEQLDEIEKLIANCLGHAESGNDLILSVEALEDRRWVVRLSGQDKEFITVHFQLHQRSLSFESYVMAFPPENQAEVFAAALRRNSGLRGLRFAIGAEDAIYLVGEIDSLRVDCAVLDQVLGSVFEATEASFLGLLHEGFASHFS